MMTITPPQDEPGVNVTCTAWSPGNRVRWSPQNVSVLAAPLCISVTTVMEVPPLVALNCTMLTTPAAVSVPEFRAAWTNMSPQEADSVRTTNTREYSEERFTDHLRGEARGRLPEMPSFYTAENG